jgi:tetratricopeptide (TPR) repeat protein/SAM-dependent methyltransferase
MTDSQAISAKAVALHRAGRLDEAIALYEEAVSRRPQDVDLTYMLGMALLQKGLAPRAVELIGAAAAARPGERRFQAGLATALRAEGRWADAARIYRRLVSDDGSNGRLWMALGDALHHAGRPTEAIEVLRQTTRRSPSSAQAHALLARSFAAAGAAGAAVDALCRARELEPGNVAYLRALADLLLEEDQPERAVEEYVRLLDKDPGNAEALSKLGVAFEQAGRAEEAEEALRRAGELSPGDGRILFRLGRFLARAGRLDQQLLVRWLEAEQSVPPILRTAALEWLAEQEELQELAAHTAETIASIENLERLAGNQVLRLLLRRTIIDQPRVERAMTALRRSLCHYALTGHSVTGPLSDLAVDLAAQCHFNEYVYAESETETAEVSALAARIDHLSEDRAASERLAIAVLASFRPLSRLPCSGRLLQSVNSADDDSLGELFRLQISEPAEELRLTTQIPRLSMSDDAVSREVRQQYEEHPYPRWIEAPRLHGDTLQTVLTGLFPALAEENIAWPEKPEILVAGCGTGLHSIITAQRFPDASILAVDLSLASLAHAERRAEEMGIGNLQFAQCDILDLPRIQRRFHVIESAGVLHHMKDPLKGWACLVEALRPGGFMKIGLYSETGREPVIEARHFVESRGFQGSTAGIRQARRTIMDLEEGYPARRILNRPDFYATSTCRDLLFHVQEHRFGLEDIGSMLNRLGLAFVGFELAGRAASREYRRRYPDDRNMVDLRNWAEFEVDHPETFAGMYLFWVRRVSD